MQALSCRPKVTCTRGTSNPKRGLRSGRLITTTMAYSSCCFEVYGRVQGVFFRAHTVDKAQQLGLVGWCMNTRQGTVKGEIQGKKVSVEQMKVWLAERGSPMSHIEKCEFTEEREGLEGLEYTEFGVQRRG